MANKDGGTHVAKKLPAGYFGLSRRNSFGFEMKNTVGTHNPGDPVRPCIRQIAYEVLRTFEIQRPDLR